MGRLHRRGRRLFSSVSAGDDSYASDLRPILSQRVSSSQTTPPHEDGLPYFKLWPRFGHLQRDDHDYPPYILELDGFADFILSANVPALTAYLSMLPAELISIIVGFLLSWSWRDDRKELRAVLSRTSRVCRSWWILQRPELFEILRLKYSGNVHFLLEMLRSRGNEWLPTTIQTVHLDVMHATDRACRLLTSKLPSLPEVHIYTHRHQPGPSLRRFLASCSSLKFLVLKDVKLFSLSALSHLLDDIYTLENLYLDGISWVNPPARPPTRMSLSSFPYLRGILCEEMFSELIWWLYAPRLARRRASPLENMTPGNLDAGLLVRLVGYLGAGSATSCSVGFMDTDRLFICVANANLCEVSYWPDDAPFADIQRVMIRCVETRWNETLAFDWESVDSLLADGAPNLETMTVYGNTPTDITKRVPKLSGLGKLRQKSEEDWNDDTKS